MRLPEVTIPGDAFVVELSSLGRAAHRLSAGFVTKTRWVPLISAAVVIPANKFVAFGADAFNERPSSVVVAIAGASQQSHTRTIAFWAGAIDSPRGVSDRALCLGEKSVILPLRLTDSGGEFFLI